VIGGLFREDSSSARSQVPFLGNIPLAGNLFRRQRDRTTREEVIILLTPHIIKDDVAYAQASEAELKAAEKLRVGVRQGMLPWGRERMAESSYETALAEMSKANPNRQRALWHLNCATNLNPKFIEAIDLKQSITGVEVTSADNSTIRSFVRRQILADKATEAPAAPAVPIEPATRPTTAPVVLKNADTSSTGTAEGGCATSEPCVAQPPPAVQPSTRPAVAHRYSLWSMMARFNRRPESQPTVVVELPAEP